jgi:hypothetical protein
MDGRVPICIGDWWQYPATNGGVKMIRISDEAEATDASAEERLWQAVIVRTVEDWMHGPMRCQQEAEEYIFGGGSDFRMVCQSAGMDPERLRNRLTRFRGTREAAA